MVQITVHKWSRWLATQVCMHACGATCLADDTDSSLQVEQMISYTSMHARGKTCWKIRWYRSQMTDTGRGEAVAVCASAFSHYGKIDFCRAIRNFAVLIFSGARQRASLPCIFYRAHGEEKSHDKFIVWRALFSAQAKTFFAVRFFATHGKLKSLPCAFLVAHGKVFSHGPSPPRI